MISSNNFLLKCGARYYNYKQFIIVLLFFEDHWSELSRFKQKEKRKLDRCTSGRFLRSF